MEDVGERDEVLLGEALDVRDLEGVDDSREGRGEDFGAESGGLDGRFEEELGGVVLELGGVSGWIGRGRRGRTRSTEVRVRRHLRKSFW